MSAINVVLKDLVTDPADMTAATIKRQPFLKYLQMRAEGGANVLHPIFQNGARNQGSSYGQASTAAAQSGGQAEAEKWSVPRGTLTKVLLIDAKTDAMSTQGQAAAWVRVKVKEIEAAAAEHGQELVRKIVGNEGLSMNSGTYRDAASGNSPTFALTFANAADMAHLVKGDQIVVSAGDGTSGAHTQVGSTGVVHSVDYENGWVRVATTAAPTVAANPGSWGAGPTVYFVFRLGDFQPGAVQNMVVPLSAYITSSPASNTFLGIDRSQNSIYSGIRLTATESANLGLLDRLFLLAARMAEVCGRPGDYSLIANPVDFNQFNQECRAQNQPTQIGKSTEGYSMIEVETALGTVQIVSEPTKPRGYALLVPRDSLYLYTGDGELASFIDQVPGTGSYAVFDQASTSNSRFKAVIESYPAFVIDHPARYGRLITT